MKLLNIYCVATLLLGGLMPRFGFATDWWNAPASLSKDAAGWLQARNENTDAFAARLQQSQKTGKCF